MEFIRNPVFWLSVVAVALIVNWFWGRFVQGGGKLV